MKCEIQWNKLSLDEWKSRFATIKRSNILQSYEYAQAMAKTHHQKARWGLIMIDGQEAGLVQIIESSTLWKMLHGVIMDRGPLWFDGFGGAVHLQAFFKEFNVQFPKRWGRKRRILPEIADGAAAQSILKQAGLMRHDNQTGYQSLWWDLSMNEESAREALKANWRNKISKAERNNLTIVWDDTGQFYPWLKQCYVMDKALRGYNGISSQLLDNLAMISTPEPLIIIGKAIIEGEAVAGIMVLLHGQSATYQIGWSSSAGREACAHHYMLWQARQVLRNYGIKDFDLGGINDEESAQGLKLFKMGTGATLYKLVGHYD